jgi:hypothetical protein
VLKYGALWAGVLVCFWAFVTFAQTRIVTTVALIAWMIFWYVVIYRSDERGKRDSTSSR